MHIWCALCRLFSLNVLGSIYICRSVRLCPWYNVNIQTIVDGQRLTVLQRWWWALTFVSRILPSCGWARGYGELPFLAIEFLFRSLLWNCELKSMITFCTGPRRPEWGVVDKFTPRAQLQQSFPTATTRTYTLPSTLFTSTCPHYLCIFGWLFLQLWLPSHVAVDLWTILARRQVCCESAVVEVGCETATYVLYFIIPAWLKTSTGIRRHSPQSCRRLDTEFYIWQGKS